MTCTVVLSLDHKIFRYNSPLIRSFPDVRRFPFEGNLAIEQRLFPSIFHESIIPIGSMEIIVDDGSTFTIFRVPGHVREENKKLYEPRLVSIGPYFRGREELRAMEQHKSRCLFTFRNRMLGVESENLKNSFQDVEAIARLRYSERTDILDDNGSRFADMLLLDGCFILEFFFKWRNNEADLLCDVGWGLTLLHSDLFLLENQIPFVILERLYRYLIFYYNHAHRNRGSERLIKLIIKYLKHNNRIESDSPVPVGPFDHLLHLFYVASLSKFNAPNQPNDAPIQPPNQVPVEPNNTPAITRLFNFLLHLFRSLFKCKSESSSMLIPCVSQLRDAGVTFRKKIEPKHMLDITFDKKKGIMELPLIEIDLARLPELVNLIAFEQTRRDRALYRLPLTSYAALMSSLVKSGKDVSVLQRRGIIENLLSDNDEAAKSYFGRLGGVCTMNYNYTDNLFAQLFHDVIHYQESRWRKYKVKFKRDYCNSPWSITAFVVGIILTLASLVSASVAVYSVARRGRHN